MVDTKVSKTFEVKSRGGSSPPLGTLRQAQCKELDSI